MYASKSINLRTYYRLQSCAQVAEQRADDGFLVAARQLLKVIL